MYSHPNMNKFVIIYLCFYAVAVESTYDSKSKHRSKSNLEPEKTLWPGGILKYQLNVKLTPQHTLSLHSAISEYQEKTCIIFEQQFEKDQFHLSIERGLITKPSCATTTECRTKNSQIKINHDYCLEKGVWILNFAISLCLTHEFQRHTGDKFGSYDRCNRTPKGHNGLHDYANQMHFACGNYGYLYPALSGLSVLDADSINRLYNCQGCFRHRWQSTQLYYQSGIQSKTSLYSFGNVDYFGREIFPCRAFHLGEIAVGMYTHEERACVIPSIRTNTSVVIKQDVELLLIPNGMNGNEQCYSEKLSYENKRPSFQYEIQSNLNMSGNDIKEAIPAASGIINESVYYEGYIAFGSISAEHYGGKSYRDKKKFVNVIGTAWKINGKLDYALFPTVGGKLVRSYHFKILVCKR